MDEDLFGTLITTVIAIRINIFSLMLFFFAFFFTVPNESVGNICNLHFLFYIQSQVLLLPHSKKEIYFGVIFLP